MTPVSPNILSKLYAEMVANRNLRRAVCYLDPKMTVKLTRQRRVKGRPSQHVYLLTVGAPNFVERAKIKTLVKAGEPFPVKKLGLQEWPVEKPKAKTKKGGGNVV